MNETMTKLEADMYVVEAGERVVVVDDGQLADKTIVVKTGAKLDIVAMPESNYVRRSVVESDAVVHWHIAAISDVEVDVRSHVAGQAGVSNIDLIFFAEKTERQKIYIGNVFDARDCKGEIFCRGVARDKASVAVTGAIEITLQGGGTDSYLKEDILMLDPTAKVNAIPSLEIKTNDVKAGHGVSIERLTDEKLFYMMSRGVSRDEAKRLTLDGFLRSMYSEFPNDDIVEKIVQKLSHE